MRLQNRSPFKPEDRKGTYRIENKAGVTDIYIYDEIDAWWGISSEDIVKDIRAVTSGEIRFHINSPGGTVFDGMAIYNTIKQVKLKTVTYIDGLAASIASIIALASDEVIMGSNAFFMIHEPWAMIVGSAEDMRKEADLLEKVRGSFVDTYEAKADASRERIEEWVEAETWFTAKEALEAGFVDSVYEADDGVDASADPRLFDLSVFKKGKKPEALNTIKPTPKDTEQALRDAGWSRKESKAILAKGLNPEPVRDAQDPDPDDPLRDAEPPEVTPAQQLIIDCAKKYPTAE